MRAKKIVLTHFSRALSQESLCIRPDNEQQLLDYITKERPKRLLARGSGLSYNDCCFSNNSLIIDTKNLNHFIRFDKHSGIVECQAGITFDDLMHLNKEFIPPVIPGTLRVTLAGGVANDVHGKNNPREQSFGHHIVWLELLVDGTIIRCSREENNSLFYATIGGLGLTGIITRLAVRLKKTPHFVHVDHKPYSQIGLLIEQMYTHGLSYDYQVAWLDLLQPKPRGILSLANHCSPFPAKKQAIYTFPRVPFSLIKKWTMKCFNEYYFRHRKDHEFLSLVEFNNPLDKINHWNYLYGAKGLLQFQAVFPKETAESVIEQLITLINKNNATPTLAVLKLFTHAGLGLLSFCTPGFTIAIDFVNNQQAQQAIKSMNQLISTTNGGRVYLAKDLFLLPEQYEKMYEHHTEFSKLISDVQSPMISDLTERLGITK
jgi:hypothetical protein